MASVSDVTLQFGAASADPRLVTVKGKLHFDANEVGDSVRLSIALHGAEPAGDPRPGGDGPGADLLYRFKWAGQTATTIPVAAAGIVNLDESRSVQASVLDEDAGVTSPQDQNNGTDPSLPGLPFDDELFARVKLVTTATGLSPTVVANPVGV